MNIATYFFREMKVLIYKLEGGAYCKLECMMWFFMFTEVETAKFTRIFQYWFSSGIHFALLALLRASQRTVSRISVANKLCA